MAPQTKLTPEIQELICADLRAGVPFAIACEYHGIDCQTGYEWVRKGENRDSRRSPTPETIEFAMAVRKAIATFDRNACLTLSEAAIGMEDVTDKDDNPVVNKQTGKVKRRRKFVPPSAIDTSKYLLERRRPDLFDQQKLVDPNARTAERPKIEIILPEDLRPTKAEDDEE